MMPTGFFVSSGSSVYPGYAGVRSTYFYSHPQGVADLSFKDTENTEIPFTSPMILI